MCVCIFNVYGSMNNYYKTGFLPPSWRWHHVWKQDRTETGKFMQVEMQRWEVRIFEPFWGYGDFNSFVVLHKWPKQVDQKQKQTFIVMHQILTPTSSKRHKICHKDWFYLSCRWPAVAQKTLLFLNSSATSCMGSHLLPLRSLHQCLPLSLPITWCLWIFF